MSSQKQMSRKDAYSDTPSPSCQWCDYRKKVNGQPLQALHSLTIAGRRTRICESCQVRRNNSEVSGFFPQSDYVYEPLSEEEAADAIQLLESRNDMLRNMPFVSDAQKRGEQRRITRNKSWIARIRSVLLNE